MSIIFKKEPKNSDFSGHAVDMDRTCRICMRTDTVELISLYSDVNGEVIANMMIDCADILVAHDDKLPGSVCSECLRRLEEFFMFRNLIRESDSTLRIMVQTPETPAKQPTTISTSSTVRTISYPTEDQIESSEEFDTYRVIRLKGVRCCGCDLIFPSKKQLAEHSLQQHYQKTATNSKDSVVYRCSNCYDTFQNRMKLLIHTKSYESNEIYHCTVCNVLFDFKYRLQQHQNMSKAHRKQFEIMTVEYLEEPPKVATLEKKRPQSRKRITKTLKYPDERYILCIDDTPEYEIIHMGGEKCCGCDLMFMTFRELLEHCNKTHPKKDENALYECDLCYKTFDQAQSLSRHKIARVQKEVYYCKFCDIVIDIKYRFDQHLKLNVAHQAAVQKAGINPTFTMEEKTPYDARVLESFIEVLQLEGVRCCGCDFVCSNREDLENHSEEKHSSARTVDTDANPFECNVCFKRFAKSGLLTYHKNLSLQKTIYKCRRCDLKSAIKHRILQHVGGSAHQCDGLYSKEKLDLRQFSCCFVRCTFVSEDPKDLLDHVEDMHSSKRKENAEERESENFVCNVCHKSFRNEKSLQFHQFPRKTDGKYCCVECGANFLYLSSLQAHERIHFGVREFQCDLCDKAFFDERTLRIHKICHNEERPFVCDVCSKSFLRKGHLKVHKRCHAESIWNCPHCEDKFKTKQSLDLHIRYHTGEKPFQCRFCEKRYSHSTDRQRHEMAAHTKVRPHKCSYCSAAFIRKRQLILHERTHSGDKPYVCTTCDKRFIQVSYLKRHLVTHEMQEKKNEQTGERESDLSIEMLNEEDEENYSLVEVLDDEMVVNKFEQEDSTLQT